MLSRSVLARGATAMVAGAVLVAFTSTTVFGDSKDNRKQLQIKVKASERTKKLEPKSDKKEGAPDASITADDFLQIEQLQSDINDQLIEEYKGAIDDSEDDDPRKPEYMFRLAEAYSQKHRYYHSRAMELELKIGQSTNKTQKAKWVKEKKAEEDKEKKYLVLAVKAYSDIAFNPKFKTYGRIDEVLFFLAYTLMQAKRPEDARKVFQLLTKQYPDSKYIPDAYLALADAYFNEGNLKDAETYYDKVLRFPKNSVYPYALYKKGWVQFNQTKFKESYASWIKVAEITNVKKKDSSLNRASKKDCVRAYAEFGDEQQAWNAFSRIDKDFAPTMFETLGRYYLDDQGKFVKAIYVFRELMRMFPKNEKVCDWEYSVVQAVISIGSPEQRIKEFENFAKLYKFIKENKVLKDAALVECRENAAGTVKEWAVFLHMEAMKTMNNTTLGFAADLYGLYQKYFPDADDSLFILYLYAELSWSRAESEKNKTLQLQRWEEVAIAFTSFVEQSSADPAKYKDTTPLLKEAMPDLKEPMRDAAYAAYLAWQKALAVETKTAEQDVDQPKNVTDCKKPEPQPLDERQVKLIAAADQYIKFITDSKDKNLVEIKFFKARIFWRYKHYDEAVPLFEDIIAKHRDHEVAEFSANLLLDSLNSSCRFDDLAVAADKLLALDNGKFVSDKPQLKMISEGIKSTSLRLAAQQLEKDGKYYECGSAYVNIYQAYSEDADAHELLFNAGVCFEKAKAFQNAITMREALVANYTTTREAKLSLYALGANYAAIAEYATAAAYYEKYARAFSGEKDASPALSNAQFFYKGVGVTTREPKAGILDGKDAKGRIKIDGDQKAIDATEYFVKQYMTKQPADAAAANYSITAIYEKNRKYDDVVKHLTIYIKRFGTKGGTDRVIIAHVKIGEILWRQSCPVKGVNGACVEVTRGKKRLLKKKIKGVDRVTCGAPDKLKIVAYDRKKGYVKEAKQHFATAIKLWKKGAVEKDIPGKDDAEKAYRTVDMNYWVAAAHFYMAEGDYEETLRQPFPKNLDFNMKKPKKAKESEKAFLGWIKKRNESVAKAKAQYIFIVNEIKGGAAHWAIASAARVGQMQQAYAGAIFTAEIPKDVYQYGIDGVDAYCDRLGEVSLELDVAANKAFEFCLNTATDKNWSNEWSQLCELELSKSDRATEFPPADEIRATADEEPVNLAIQPIATEIAK